MITIGLDLRTLDPALGAAVEQARWQPDAGLDAQPGLASPDAVLVVVDRPLRHDEEQALLARTAQSPVLLVGPTLLQLEAGSPLLDAAGLLVAGVTPRHEIRLRSDADADPHGDGDLAIDDSLVLVDKATDDVVVTIHAAMGLAERPVATWRPGSGVGALSVGTSPATWADREFLRLLHRWLRTVLGHPRAPDVRVGLLGYGAIGHEHSRAVAAVPGLALGAVCDRSPGRVDAARQLAPDVVAIPDADDLVTSDLVDLVVVSTPPDTHAGWVARALDAGKHVVVEKPMALSTGECDDLMTRAAAQHRTLVVYQNRRWDPDYRALRKVVRQGRIGELFHLESFVGGYGHPCNFWHSDAGVSGGAIFDWGSHYLDQILDLMPGEVEFVTATNHKRVWHDVTNADHARVLLHFSDGTEAEFVHSDLAAALKPKWYVLGTKGAVRGEWRSERVVSRNDIGTLAEDQLAPADSPADLFLHDGDGSVTRLAIPPVPAYAFHRELAEQLHEGLPMSVDAAQSRRVVAVMEAAEESARTGSRSVSLR